MTDKEILETAAKNAAEIVRLEQEVDRLKGVMNITQNEAMAGGFVQGLAYRKGVMFDEFDIKMLTTAGRCIARIINHQPPEEK